MKKIDRVILTLFSVLIFIESVLVICVVTRLLDTSTIIKFMDIAITDVKISKIILAIAIICLIGATKCIFFDSSEKEPSKAGVLMQNDNGKLLISKSTIENIVSSVVKDFDSVDDVQVSMDLDSTNNLIVNVNLVVSQDVIIKELTLNIQNKIKDAIKRTSDLDVKEVNVKIKNITTDSKNEK